MKLLILKKFNNYFNRKIIKYDNLDDYASHSAASLTINSYNFNPNDGVRTDVVLGKGDKGLDAFFDFETTKSADYLVAYSTETIHNGDEPDVDVNTIESRWFITEVKRTRGGQYAIQLKRDSIADNLSTLINCPAFIRKGTLDDNNPLIVNDEGVRFNQIKTSETLLKDKTNSAWIVGYFSKDFVDKTDPDNPISVQVPDGDYESITIEDLALELGVSSTTLESILVTDPNNQVRFVNDNIEFVAWLNKPDLSALEDKIIGNSSNLLQSFTSGSGATVASHSNVNDCFAYEESQSSIFRESIMWRAWNNRLNENINTIRNNWSSYVGHPLLGRKVYEKLLELQNNETLIYKAGLYYQVKVGGSSVVNTGETYSVSATMAPFNSICSNYINDINSYAGGTQLLSNLNRGTIFINYNELTANIYLTNKLTDTTIPTVSVDISTSRNGVLNQPFDMFAMPFNDTIIVDGVDSYEVTGDYAQKLAIALMAVETNGQIYDLQLLPYCPMPELAVDNGINLTGRTEHFDYDWIDYAGTIEEYHEQYGTPEANEYAQGQYEAVLNIDTGEASLADILTYGYQVLEGQELLQDNITARVESGTVHLVYYGQIQDPRDADEIYVQVWWKTQKAGTEHRSVIIYPKSNSFSVDLDHSLELSDSMKIDSQTDLYRLVSPNYQGSFDFNVAKNGGRVEGFIADCTYKPYTPYVKVAPQFAWLYGTNYGDARGLICGGDFSIGFYSDRWQEYQLQNKNYQNIFNREIQNLDVNQGIQRTQQYVSGGLGIINSAAQGAVTGAIATGSPWGALAGGVIAGGASGAGYAADNVLMEKSLIEQRQFALDKFNMQLENIQALPYTLTKVDAFNINSKIWPFLEYYTCSDVEKEALRMKIQYEGMTVGIVDVLGSYMNNGYLQADLIRNDDIIDDPHQLEDIYIELTKGVYM